MKQIVLAAAIACTVLAACNNSANTTDARKDSLDSVAKEEKNRVDSSAGVQKAQIDTARKDEKQEIDSSVERKKRALDRRDSIHRADSIKRHGK